MKMKGCAGVVGVGVCVCYGGGKTARCLNEAFVLVYSTCAGMDGLVWLCVMTLSLSLPTSPFFLVLKLNIDKTQTDPNIFSSPMHKSFNLAKHKTTVYSWAFDEV